MSERHDLHGSPHALEKHREMVAMRWWSRPWQLVCRHAKEPLALADGHAPAERLAYGLAQPFLGLKLLLQHAELRRRALLPVAVVAAFCSFVAWAGSDGSLARGLTLWWGTFFGLAPLPPLLFARQYSKLAAEGRTCLGLGLCNPHRKSWIAAGKEWTAQLVILSIGVAPLALLLAALPAYGDAAGTLLIGGWTLHWMTIEGLDAARTEPVTDPGRVAHAAPPEPLPSCDPWFVRALSLPIPAWAALPLLPSRWMARIVARFSRGWSPELRLVERSPWETIGFGLGSIFLVTIPGLNLLFRPAVVLGGVHLRARLESDHHSQPS